MKTGKLVSCPRCKFTIKAEYPGLCSDCRIRDYQTYGERAFCLVGLLGALLAVVWAAA